MDSLVRKQLSVLIRRRGAGSHNRGRYGVLAFVAVFALTPGWSDVLATAVLPSLAAGTDHPFRCRGAADVVVIGVLGREAAADPPAVAPPSNSLAPVFVAAVAVAAVAAATRRK